MDTQAHEDRRRETEAARPIVDETVDAGAPYSRDRSDRERDARREAQITEYGEDLLSGQVFQRAARGKRSYIGYRPPTGHRQYAEALKVLAAGAALNDRQATLVREVIGRLALHGIAGDALGKLYEVAAEAIARPYFDTINAASPEPGRRSDNERPYTLADVATFAVTLHEAAAKLEPDIGIGWCLDAILKREQVVWTVRRKDA